MASSIPQSFVKSVLHNGVGRHVCQLQRITFRFCKSHGGSRGVRDFIEKNLIDFARANPGIVVYLKPRRYRSANITGVYLNGKAKSVCLSGKPVEEVCQWVSHLREVSGFEDHRLIRTWITHTPSIQGSWTPFLNQDPEMNITNFPSDKPVFQHISGTPSATETILEMAKQMSLEDKEKPLIE